MQLCDLNQEDNESISYELSSVIGVIKTFDIIFATGMKQNSKEEFEGGQTKMRKI